MINPSDPALPWSGNLDAWQQMFSAMGQLPANWGNMSASLDPQELDRRIAELRTVENWLKLNLGMLQSSIHGLEVQRATLAALRSFGTVPNAGTPAPWWETPQTARKPDTPAPQAAPKPSPAPEPAAAPPSPKMDEGAGANQAAMSDAAQAWWAGLTRQFEQLAQTAQAAMPAPSPLAAMPAKPAATGRTRPPAASKPVTKAAANTQPAAGKTAGKSSAKTTGGSARKTSPRKTGASRSRNA